MDQEPDSWIDNPKLHWTPEPAVRLEPKFVAPTAANDGEISEPRIENPRLSDAVEAIPGRYEPLPTRDLVEAAKIKKAGPRFKPYRKPRARPSPSLYVARMSVGLAQGFGLFALFACREFLNPAVFSGALMVLVFAPLLLLAGFGRMRFGALLAWAGFASVLLAAVGAYHRWRTLASDAGHPGLTLLALTGLFLLIAQAIAQGKVGNYTSYQRAAWRLSIRIAICALFAGLAWTTAGAGVGFMREHYAWFPFDDFIIPLTALGAALGAQLTGERFLGALQEGVMFVFVMAMPLVLLAAMAVAGLGAPGYWRPSLAVPLALGVLLIICINASYRDGMVWRAYWRRRSEFAGALTLVPLAILAGLSLAARVHQYGWTDTRIFAAAAVLMLGFYALCYAASALIGMGGGGWMQRIEGSNLMAAFAGLGLIAALASPLGDPARLAVTAQRFRLEQHKVAPEAFDYTWLRDGGLSFGHQALMELAAMKEQPVARGAYLALSARPLRERPAPSEIGANIHMHDGRMPAALLARDWTGVEGAPPCLTAASMTCDGFFADLDGDGVREIMLTYGTDAHWWASVVKQGVGGGWYVAGTLAAPPCPGSLSALRDGHFSAVRPSGDWRDLVVDGLRLSVNRPKDAVACPSS